MNDAVRLGSVTWRWATNVVCAGPDERLIVIRDQMGASAADAQAALERAERMEWRDSAFRKWRIHRSGEGVTFVSHYERLGPVALESAETLAALSSERLESLLAAAREGGEEGTSVRPRT